MMCWFRDLVKKPSRFYQGPFAIAINYELLKISLNLDSGCSPGMNLLRKFMRIIPTPSFDFMCMDWAFKCWRRKVCIVR